MRTRFAVLAAALTIGLVSAPPLAAQNQGGGRGPGGGMQARVLQGITLTPAQQAQVDTITAAARAMMPERTPGVPMSDADRATARNVMMGSLSDIREILTPDQRKVFDQNLAAMQEQMQQRMQGGQRGGPPPATPATPATPAQPSKP